MQAADASVREAGRLGDQRLMAQALAGRAEIRILRGEPGLAILEAERALAMHREMQDAVRETEDLRILAVAVGVAGKTDEAERMLREVIDRATEHARPMLVAAAQRDLAYLWARHGDVGPAKEMARSARAAFHRLGSKVEIDKMTALLTQPHPGAPKIGLADPAPTAVDLDAVPQLRDTMITKRETIGPA
jgi:ATP/maltotriose-dependent transcriptional regulator MalT